MALRSVHENGKKDEKKKRKGYSKRVIIQNKYTQ